LKYIYWRYQYAFPGFILNQLLWILKHFLKRDLCWISKGELKLFEFSVESSVEFPEECSFIYILAPAGLL
jgi:hypothetical protein